METLIVEEFIQGVKSQQRTPEELEILANVTQRMEGYLKMNDSIKFVEMSTQKCSDLLVYISKSDTSVV